MIVLARDYFGWSQLEFAERLGIAQSKLSKYENGPNPVSEEDLASMSRVTGFHREFFFLTETIYGLGSSAIFNRKKKTVQVGVQRMIQSKFNVARFQVLRLLAPAEIEATQELQQIDLDTVDGDPTEVARRVRHALRLPMGPVFSVTRAIESAGGIVALCNFGTRDIDAVHLWATGEPPLFFMNAEAPGDKHRWTLAHELGHAIMHRCAAGDVEAQANAFAREFLMPASEIAPELRNLSLESLVHLKQRWRVSMAAIARCAYEIGVINKIRYQSFFKMLSRMGYRTNEPIQVEIERPTLIPQLVDLHKKHLGYSDDEMLALMMTDDPDFIGPSLESGFRRTLRIPVKPVIPESISFEDYVKKQKA